MKAVGNKGAKRKWMRRLEGVGKREMSRRPRVREGGNLKGGRGQVEGYLKVGTKCD